jgi:hypothetical protein
MTSQADDAGRGYLAQGNERFVTQGEVAREDDQVIVTDDPMIVTNDEQAGGGDEPTGDGQAGGELAGGEAPGGEAPGGEGLDDGELMDGDQIVATNHQPRATGLPALVPARGSATADQPSRGVRWHEIQAMFVDDPRTSVQLAANLLDDSTEAFVASLRERQQAMQSAWQGADADTEGLRTALQQYRALWDRLEDFSG